MCYSVLCKPHNACNGFTNSAHVSMCVCVHVCVRVRLCAYMCVHVHQQWGQWSSTRPDMFPESLCRALSQLHSDAPKHSAKHTRTLVERTFGGRRLEEVFDCFAIPQIGHSAAN